MDLRPGASFGAYDITGRLGEGGMGVVYRALHRNLEREVALKLLSPALGHEMAYRNRFLREARTLARLESPQVVRVYDAGEHDGVLYIATQLIPGGDLDDYLRARGRLAPHEAVELLRQVAIGVQAGHRLGILHRDIKPANVLLDRAGARLRAVVCDLGIAQAQEADHTRTQGVIGTWAYLAPERHDGVDATVGSDIYALGCLLWAMLSGEPPFGGTPSQMILGHLQGPIPQVPAGVPLAAPLNRALTLMLAKRPEERPADVDAVLALLAGLDREPPTQPASPGPPPPAPPVGPPPVSHTAATRAGAPPPRPPATPSAPSAPSAPRRRSPVLAAAAAALVLVAGGVLAAVVLGSDDAPDDAGADPTTTTSGSTPSTTSADAPTTSTTSGAAAQYPDFHACVLADSGGFGDRSFNDLAAAGLEDAAAELGVHTTTREPSSESDYEPLLATLVGQGCDLVTSVGFLTAEAMSAASADAPDVAFEILDYDPSSYPASGGEVKGMVFDVRSASFLAGYVAAGTSSTGTVGTFGGLEVPTVTDFMEGFRLGVKRYNADTGSDVEVVGWDGSRGVFTNDFSDVALSSRAARRLIRQGADVLFPVVGPAGEGALAEARSAGVHAIWPDVDGCRVTSYCDVMITSVLKQIDVAVLTAVREAAEGRFTSRAYVGTLANGGVGIAPPSDAVPADVVAGVEDLESGLVDGSITIE